MEKALKVLLDELETIAEEYEEVTDTDVREQMREGVERSLIEPEENYTLPETFAMFSPDANSRVRMALLRFIDAARVEAAEAGLTTRKARLEAFQNIAVESRGGNTYDEYFGYDDSAEDESPPV